MVPGAAGTYGLRDLIGLTSMIFLHFQVVGLNTQLRYFRNVEKQLRQKRGDEAAKKILLGAVYLAPTTT